MGMVFFSWDEVMWMDEAGILVSETLSFLKRS